MDRITRLPGISALAGGVLWFGILFVRIETNETELIQKILLLGILVVVPLGLLLVATPNRDGTHSLPYRLAVIAQPIGALASVVSFLLEPGMTAAVLASLWLLVVVLIAWFGLSRFLRRGLRPSEEFCIDAGLIYVAVGGVWFTMSRLGTQPLGFGDTIVLLTAVHFHFAGFAAPILAGLTGRTVAASGRARILFRLAAMGIVSGTPLVAVGITFSPLLALVGAIVISFGLVLLAIVVLSWLLRSSASLPGRILLAVSSISSSIAMVLACLYAYSIVEKTLIIDIPRMAMTHGIVNAFGFALCGLLGWLIVGPKSRVFPPGVPFSKLPTQSFAGPNYFDRVGALSNSKPQPLGLVDDFSIYRRADFDPDSVDPVVRSFYEETFRYRLVVRPHWRFGFRLGGRIAHSFGTRVGQLRLPIAAESQQDHIESRLLPLDDSIDGRSGVRGWIRTYAGTDGAMYVAAYASHSMMGNTYMNIAFPLPGGNLTSILRITPHTSGDSIGVILSTLAAADPGGDQGVYFANRLMPVRLPVSETITVWRVDSKNPEVMTSGQERPVLRAKHQMWLFGINFLELDYDIFPRTIRKPQLTIFFFEFVFGTFGHSGCLRTRCHSPREIRRPAYGCKVR